MSHEDESSLSMADQEALLQPWPELTEHQRRIQRGTVAMLGTVEQALGPEKAAEFFARPNPLDEARLSSARDGWILRQRG